MRKAIIVPVVAGLIGFGSLAAPLAAHADGTPVSFGLTAGELVLTAPTAAAALTADSAQVGQASTATGQIGTVNVADNLGDNAGWAVQVASTDFTVTGGATVAAHKVSYASGSITGASGDATPPTFTAVSLTAFPATASVPMTAASAGTDGIGSNGASWDPAITVPLPAYGQSAGSYSGTITLSLVA